MAKKKSNGMAQMHKDSHAPMPKMPKMKKGKC